VEWLSFFSPSRGSQYDEPRSVGSSLDCSGPCSAFWSPGRKGARVADQGDRQSDRHVGRDPLTEVAFSWTRSVDCSDLHLREDRGRAHILVCFLADVLWKTLEQGQRRAGLGNSPRTILEELRRIQSTDIVLPLADEASRALRLRCVVRPDAAQARLLDRLGLQLPDAFAFPAPTSEWSADSPS
jgi:hypothetical protein